MSGWDMALMSYGVGDKTVNRMRVKGVGQDC